MRSFFAPGGALLMVAAVAFADVPQQINHQGLVQVDGVPFDGTGQFKFAILNASGVNVWTNDASNLILNGVPNTFEDVEVVNGIYSVILGGTGPGYTMSPIAADVFDAPQRKLRIWFDDGVNGVQQLAPDHALTSSPYAHQAAFQPPIGSIMAWHKNLPGVPALPDGWAECNGQLLNDSASPLHGQTLPDLNNGNGYSNGKFLRGGTTSGQEQEATFHFDDNGTRNARWLTTPVEREMNVVVGVRFPDGTFDGSVSARHTAARPVNMSVVWIMRVK